MKTIQYLSVYLIVAVCSLTTSAADYDIDPAHTSIAFKVKHLGISTVTGRFDKFSGTVSLDGKDLKTLKTSATIEAASVNTGVEKRDAHLRNADFFDTAKFPQLTFVSKEVKDIAGDKCKLVGDLTMHGVTKSVTLEGEFGGTSSAFGAPRIGFSASTTVKRSEFGITGGNAGAVIGEDIKITLEIEAVAKK